MFTDYFDLDSLISLLKKTGFWSGFDEKAVGGLNGLLNLLFGVGKLIVQSGNTLIDNVYSVDVLNKYLDSAFSSGKTVWDTVFSTFGVVFLTLLFVYGIRDFLRVGLHKIYLRLVTFSLLAILAMGFFSRGSELLKEVNHISSQAQSALVTKMAPNYNSGGEKIAKELGLKQPTDSTKKVENMLYYKFVMEPFALMNFGKTTISGAQYKDYTAKKGTYDEKDKAIEQRVSAESKKNAYLTGKKLGDKSAVLLNTGIDYLIVAGIVLMISVLNFLTQIFILSMVLIAPIWLALALLPDNEQVLANGMKLLFGAFGVKIALGVGFGFTFMILGWIDSAFTVSNVIDVMASLIVKVILAVLVVKNFHSFRRLLLHGELDGSLRNGLHELQGQSFKERFVPPSFESASQSMLSEKDASDTGFHSVLEASSRPNELYGENIQLSSALEDTRSKPIGESMVKGAGYLNERGLVNSAKDKALDAFHKYYDGGFLENAVTETEELIRNPKDYMKGKAEPYVQAFQEGQFIAVEKERFQPEVHTRDYAHETQEQEAYRYAMDEEKQEEKIIISERNDEAYVQQFYSELAQLRREPLGSYQEELIQAAWQSKEVSLTDTTGWDFLEPAIDSVSREDITSELEESIGGENE